MVRSGIALAAVVLAVLAGGCGRTTTPQRDYLGIVFPNEWIGDIDKAGFGEPSGICWHAGRGTLFVVGDEGDICEMKTDGTMLRQKHIRDADMEGITYDPASGLLYIAVEEDEAILEVHPETFEVLREWAVPRQFAGRTLMRKGGEGFEGITFMPDPAHKEGGIFYVANQAFVLTDPEDVSAILRVELPLRSNTGPARILDYFEPGIIDLAALHYDAQTGNILAVCDSPNMLLIYSPRFELLDFYAFPGDNQEGVTVDSDGFIYIAQDAGGIIKLKWLGR